jgi:hypothetical protein
MFKGLVKLLTAFSLLVCVAAVMLWARSLGEGERFGWRSSAPVADRPIETEYAVRSVTGRLQFVCYGVADRPAPLPAVTVTETSSKAQAKAQPVPRTGRRPGLFWEPLSASKDDAVRPGAVPVAEQEATSFRLYDQTVGALRVRGVMLPYWCLVAVTALLPVRGLLRAGQRARMAQDPHDPNPDRVPFSSSILQSIASAFAIFAFLMTCLWVRSWYVGDRLSYGASGNQGSRIIDMHSGKGEFVLHTRTVEGRAPRPVDRDESSVSDGLNWRSDSDGSVGYTSQTFALDSQHQVVKEGSVHTLTMAAPFWAIVISALMVPVWWVRRLQYGPMNVMEIGAADRAGGRDPAHAINQRPL